MDIATKPVLEYRTIFISDIHLGTKGSQTEMLLDFLKNTESKHLYLVGDIIDGWRMKRSWHWDQHHNDVIQKLLRKARKGTRLTYIPGNHDENFRDFTDYRFGNVSVLNETIHHAVDGKKFLVLHGDQFDGIVLYAKWLAFIGDHAYIFALFLNHWLNRMRRFFGLPYWSLSAYLKHRVKNAVKYISSFENAVVNAARSKGMDGVICGHIHTAEIRDYDGVLYMNDGDWVESCTALVEHFDGRFEILNWSQIAHLQKSEAEICDS